MLFSNNLLNNVLRYGTHVGGTNTLKVRICLVNGV